MLITQRNIVKVIRSRRDGFLIYHKFQHHIKNEINIFGQPMISFYLSVKLKSDFSIKLFL